MVIKNVGATDSGLRALLGVVLLGISASLNDRLTRGGPLVKAPAGFNGGFWGDTDSRKRFYYWFEYDFSRSQSGGWYNGVYPGVTWKPAPNISLSVSPHSPTRSNLTSSRPLSYSRRRPVSNATLTHWSS